MVIQWLIYLKCIFSCLIWNKLGWVVAVQKSFICFVTKWLTVWYLNKKEWLWLSSFQGNPVMFFIKNKILHPMPIIGLDFAFENL